MNNRQVVEGWKAGRSANSRHLHTDGHTLWSYNLEIGYTILSNFNKGGIKVVKNYMVSGKYISSTTSHHTSIAKRYADKVVQP